MRDQSSFALIVSHETQQKLDVSGADLKVGVDIYRKRSMMVDVSSDQVAECGGGGGGGKTNSLLVTRMICQLKSRSWLKASRCTIGTRSWRCL